MSERSQQFHQNQEPITPTNILNEQQSDLDNLYVQQKQSETYTQLQENLTKQSQQINLLPVSMPQNAPQKRCSSCRIAQNSSFKNTQVILIELQIDEYYCDGCLQQLYLEQQASIKRIEEKYIYQKQFETSGMANQLSTYSQKFYNQEKQYCQLKEEVIGLQNEQKKLDQYLKQAKRQCSQLQQNVYNLQKKEQKFWQEINRFQKRAIKLQQKNFTVRSQKQYENLALQKMSRGNILHQFFKIQIEDNYGQVYGLTIGKKPDMFDINWQVTNSGLAHLLLAYNYLAQKYSIPFTRIQQMKIKGSLSEILLRNSQNFYSICYLGKQNQKQFGMVMDALLLELHDLAQTIQQIQNIEYSQQFKLPFPIDKKQIRIMDMPVNPLKIQEKSKWNTWTKSMRYFLINFKHLLTISSLHDPYL